MSYYARIRIRPDWCIALRLIALSELLRQNELFLEENNFLPNMRRGVNDIVDRLQAEPYWVGGSQQQSEGDSNTAPFEAADLIERQRKALRVAREALNVFAERLVEKRHIEIADDAIAAIDAALKETGE